MRIIITQAEIEEAISDKVLSQMSINDDMELKINLAATRGEEGYTATIDVSKKVEEEPIKVPARRGRPPATATAQTAASEPVTPKPEPVQEEETPEVDEDQTPQTDTPPPATGSIFGKLRKPVNTPAEAE